MKMNELKPNTVYRTVFTNGTTKNFYFLKTDSLGKTQSIPHINTTRKSFLQSGTFHPQDFPDFLEANEQERFWFEECLEQQKFLPRNLTKPPKLEFYKIF